jgi:hypothetical protein
MRTNGVALLLTKFEEVAGKYHAGKGVDIYAIFVLFDSFCHRHCHMFISGVKLNERHMLFEVLNHW